MRVHWTIWLGAAAWMAGCGGEGKPARDPDRSLDAIDPKAPLHVASVDPTDPFSMFNSLSVFIQFVEPVIAAERVGQTLSSPPLRVDPELPLEARWVDRSTLVVEVKKSPLEEGTIEMRFAGDLAGKTDRAGFRFHARFPRVKSLYAENRQYLSRDPELELRFEQPVPTRDVAARCVLQDPAGRRVTLRSRDSVDTTDAVALMPTGSLKEDTDYVLRCRGMGAWDAEQGRAKDFVEKVHTAPPFRLLNIELVDENGSEIREADPDDVRIRMQFSAPVEPWEVDEHVHFVPPHPARDDFPRWRRETSTSVLWNLRLDGPKRYRLEVDGKLQDELGRPLGVSSRFTFRTLVPRPGIRFRRGKLHVLDAEGPGFEVVARSMRQVVLRCAKVTRGRVVSWLKDSGTTWIGPRVLGKDEDPGDYPGRSLRLRERRIDYENFEGGWQKQFVNLPEACGGGSKGLYVLRFEAPPPEEGSDTKSQRRAQVGEVEGTGEALVNVTDLGVFLKVGVASSLVWVVRLSDGQPVPGARVAVYALDRRLPTSRAVTDASGIARLPGAARLTREEQEDVWSAPSMWVTVQAGDDLAVLHSEWNDGIATWNFRDISGGPFSGPPKRLRAFLQTDRGLYRPGETVHFHGYVRVQDERDRLAKVPRRVVTLQVEDSRGQRLIERELRLSPYGSFSFSLPLSEDAPVGSYRFVVKAMNQEVENSFRVKEFRRTTVEMKLEAEASDVLAKQAAKIRLLARFLHGAPVTGGRVTWTVQRRIWPPYFPGFDEFTFADYVNKGWTRWYVPEDKSDEVLGEREMRTDGKGEALLSWDTEETSMPQRLIFTAEMTPEGDRPVTKRVTVLVHPHDRYVGLAPEWWVVRAGEALSVRVARLSKDGKPSPGMVRVQAQRCVRMPPRAWRLRDCQQWQQAVDRQVQVGADGKGRVEIRFPTAGTWALRVVSKDGQGHRIVASDTVYVTGSGADWAAGDEDSPIMPLVPSKQHFEPGEVATLVPLTDMKQTTALLTLERRGILWARTEKLEDPGVGIEIPLSEEHAPVVYASTLLFAPRSGPSEPPRFQMGVVELPVSVEPRRLHVQVEPRAKEVEPGTPVQVRLRVRDANGAPKRAELAVAVVDEGVLQVIGYRTPDPLRDLYSNTGLAVSYSTNLLRFLEPIEIYDPGGAGADAAPKRRNRQRKKFPPLAYWNPRVLTDEQGMATIDFQAPDALTAYRIMVVGADGEQRFGAGEARVTVRKELMVEPSLPRFVRPGDEMQLPVAVSNRTARDFEVALRAEAQGAVIEPRRRKVAVPAGQRVVVRFTLHDIERGTEQLRLRFVGRSGALRDDVVKPIPVRFPTVTERDELLAGWVQERKEVHIGPAASDALRDELVLRLDAVGEMSRLAPALHYLIRYPYGCLEQTLSRMLPLLAVRQFGELLDDATLRDGRVHDYLSVGVKKLHRFQRYDGRFHLWPDDGSDVYLDLSALAVWALHQAKAAGFTVDATVLSLGTSALRKWALQRVAEPPNAQSHITYEDHSFSSVALAAFVLAQVGKPVPELEAKLMEYREQLDPEALAWLWASMATRQGRTAREHRMWLHERVLQLAREKDGGLVVDLNLQNYYGMASSARATAVALLAVLREGGDPHLVHRLTQGLFSLQEGGHWGNTQANFWAITALVAQGRHAAMQGDARIARLRFGDHEESLRIADVKVHTVRFAVPSDGGTLHVTVEGDSPLYTYVVRERRRDASDLPANAHGFRLTRRYVDPRTGHPVQRLRLGQLVRVEVEVTVERPGMRRFLATVAPLPAGLEPVDTSLATEQGVVEDPGRWDWSWDYRELRDDRVQAFRDTWGGHVPLLLRFLARATTVGRFVAPGARAEAMYRPSVQGRTAAGRLEVVE